MNIKTIQEAKKYIGKIVYTAHNFGAKRNNTKISLNKVAPLYIGGVHLFYNQVDYDVMGFQLYENEKCTENWGDVKLDRISDNFDAKNRSISYFFSKTEAEKYCIWLNKDEEEHNKERDIEYAKELLNKYKIKFEIFD